MNGPTETVQVHFDDLDLMGILHNAKRALTTFWARSTSGATVHATGRRAIVRLDPATLRPTPWTEATRTVATNLLRPERTRA